MIPYFFKRVEVWLRRGDKVVGIAVSLVGEREPVA